MMQQLLPLLLDWLSASPDPDLGLLGLRKLASGDRRATALAHVFRDSPDVARRLCDLLGTSALLGDVLGANPDLIPRLADPERLQTLDREELVASATGTLSWRSDLDERQRALRRWRGRHLLGVAARDVFGQADVATVGRDLTAQAEACVEAALTQVDPQVPFAVVAIGRFAGGELSYASDLDVLFVHDVLGGEDERADHDEGLRAAGACCGSCRGPRPRTASTRSTPRCAPRDGRGRSPAASTGTGPTSTGGPRRGSARRWPAPGRWPVTPSSVRGSSTCWPRRCGTGRSPRTTSARSAA